MILNSETLNLDLAAEDYHGRTGFELAKSWIVDNSEMFDFVKQIVPDADILDEESDLFAIECVLRN